MKREVGGFSIQKFVGVAPQQFANLQAVLAEKPIREDGREAGIGKFFHAYAEILRVEWNSKHETLTVTVEVAIYDYRRKCFAVRGSDSEGDYERDMPTERWVVDMILDALERFPKKEAQAA